MKNIIEITNLNKSFGEIKAVSNLTFCVKEGELFAFLGVNGAGKSTTISIMCGMLEKDSGEVIIDGDNIENNSSNIRKKIGVVFQQSLLDKVLTVDDNLMTKAILYGFEKKDARDRINELAKVLDFEDLLKRPLNKLSGGQLRRIDIARALLNKPKILILDEPTTGLDPKTRSNIWEVVTKLRKEEGITVFLTTHYMEEAADADYVVILESGKIAAHGTPNDLKNEYSGDYITVYNPNIEKFNKLNLKYEKIRDAIRIEVKNTLEARDLIMNNLELFEDFEITKGKMDDIFLQVTGKKLERGN